MHFNSFFNQIFNKDQFKVQLWAGYRRRVGRFDFALIIAAAFTTLATTGALNGLSAADLGGDCCAVLEERIADLEATTARKGNRKVSLRVSGYVAQEITWWDDGGESNIYLHGLGPTQATHVASRISLTIPSEKPRRPVRR